MPNPLEGIMKLEANIERILNHYGCRYVQESLNIDASGYMHFSYYFPLERDEALSKSQVDEIIAQLEMLNPDLTLAASRIEMDHLRGD